MTGHWLWDAVFAVVAVAVIIGAAYVIAWVISRVIP